MSNVAPPFPTSLEGSTRAVKAGWVPVFVHCTLPVNNLKGDTKKLHDLHLRDQNQLYGSSINVDVQLKTMEATARDPENSGWYKII